MEKRIIGMVLSFTILLTTINVALPLGVLAENEETSVPIVTETIESPEETTEYAPVGEASGEPVATTDIMGNIASGGTALIPDESVLNDPVMTPENREKLEAYKAKLLEEMEAEGYAVDNSAVSLFSTDIPTFNQYLADYNYNFNCYNFYKNDFKLPYRSFVETKRDDPTYQALLGAWRVATFSLSDIVTYSTKEIGFYETILFDVLYQGKDVESLSGMLKDGVDTVEASSFKKISKFLGEDFDNMFYQNVTTMTADQLESLNEACQSCEELTDVFGAIGNISKVLGYVDNVEELLYKLAKAQVIAETTNETAQILITMQMHTSNLAMSKAIDNMILVCSENTSEESVTASFTSDMVVGELLDYLLGEIWTGVLKHLNLYGYAVNAGQAAGKLLTGWLFGTDESVEMYYSACALYEFEDALRAALSYYESQYVYSQSDSDSAVFNECYKLLLKTYLLGSKTSQKFVDVEYKHGLIKQLLFNFKEEKYNEYSEKLKNITGYVEQTLEFMNVVAYNGYCETYCSDVASIIDMVPKTETYTEDDKQQRIELLNTLSLETNNWIITKDMTLNSDIHTYGYVNLQYGTLNINGHRLEVDGDFIIANVENFTENGVTTPRYYSTTAVLQMTDPADYVKINGDFISYAGSSYNTSYVDNSLLNAGVMEVSGDFNVYSGDSYNYYMYSFYTGGSHKVILNGTDEQNVSFDYKDYSGFNSLVIESVTGKINFITSANIRSKLTQPGGAEIQSRDNVTLQNKPAFEDHGELNAAINKYVGNAENVIPTWMDYEAYINQTGSVEPTPTPPSSWDYTINKITAENGNVSIDLTKNSGSGGKLIAASYTSDGTLVGVTFKDIALVDNELHTIDLELNTDDAAYITAFMWDNITSMKPISEKENKDL